MTKEEKALIIDELKEKFSAHLFFYITDAGGMSVADTNQFRKMCFDKGIEYKVFKNTLIKKALESFEADYSPFNQAVLKGFSGVLFSNESGSEPAKLLKVFKDKGKDKPALKGASIDSSLYIGEDNLEILAKIKSKTEMLGELVGLLQSPAQNLVSALKSSGSKLAGVLKTLSEKEGD